MAPQGGDAPTYERQVPRFLEGYEHLLGSSIGKSDDPGPSESELASKRAKSGQHVVQETEVEGDDSEPAPQILTDSEAATSLAAEQKRLGNSAFDCNPAKAISHYTTALSATPSSAVLFANRSAARLRNCQPERALSDAHSAISLDSSWPKAHARLGAALVALERYSDAVDAYSTAVNEEPENVIFANEKAHAEQLEHDALRRGNVKAFSRKRTSTQPSANSKPNARYNHKRHKREDDAPSSLLSFAEEETS